MILLPNEFSYYEYTPAEATAVLRGVPQELEFIIQTRIAVLCRERLEFEIDPANLHRSLQTEAAMKGGIQELQALLHEIQAAKQTTAV